MSIDNYNEKLGLIHFLQPYQPPMLDVGGSLDRDDRQQLIWGYPGILWGSRPAIGVGMQLGAAAHHFMKRRRKHRI